MCQELVETINLPPTLVFLGSLMHGQLLSSGVLTEWTFCLANFQVCVLLYSVFQKCFYQLSPNSKIRCL